MFQGVTAPSEKEDKTDNSPGRSRRETKRRLLMSSETHKDSVKLWSERYSEIAM